MRHWLLVTVLLLPACLFAAEGAAEIIESDDAPANVKPAPHPQALPSAQKPAEPKPVVPTQGDTPPTIVADDPKPAPVAPPLEIDEPGFKAKVTYKMEGSGSTETSGEKKPDVVVRDWGLPDEEGVERESDPVDARESVEEISPLLAKAIAKDKAGRKPKEIIDAYQAVVEAEPENAEAQFQLGVALVKSGEIIKGATALEQAVLKKPKNTKYLCVFGQAALQAGWMEKALIASQAAAAAAPSNAQYQSAFGDVLLGIGKYPEAAAAYSRAIAIDKGKNPAYIYNLGLVHLHCREFKKAIQVFDEAITSKNDYAPYYCSRGLAYENLKQIKLAGQDYLTALKIDKNNAYAHFLLAGIYSDPSDPTYTNKFEAVSHAEKACKLTEFKNARYLMGLARALRVAFNYDDAIIAAKKAIAIDPRPEYKQELAKYEAQLKQEGAFLNNDKK